MCLQQTQAPDLDACPDRQVPITPSDPALSRPQDLDFFGLTWEHFERLCYRLMEARPEVRSVTPYGVRGESQDGIDLLVDRQDGHREGVQCKRVRSFGPAAIEKAGDAFLKGGLAATGTCFVLCSAEALQSRDRLRALDVLRDRGIWLDVWDATRMSTALKSHRGIVADLFGEPTASAFIGPDAGWDPSSGLEIRYLVSRSTELTADVASGDTTTLPGGPHLVWHNAVLPFLHDLLPQVGRSFVRGRSYPAEWIYRLLHPRSRQDPWSTGWVRVPSRAEVDRRVLPRDSVSRGLLAAHVPLHEVVAAHMAYDECGSPSHKETYGTRPLWTVFLQIVNHSGRAVHIDIIEGVGESVDGFAPRPLAAPPATLQSLSGPAAAVGPGGSVLVPVATVAAPLDAPGMPVHDGMEWSHLGEQAQTHSVEDVRSPLRDSLAIGPAFWPRAVSARPLGRDAAVRVTVRPFDPARVAMISREWQIGSCPHLFVCTQDGLRYVRPLFTHIPGSWVEEVVRVPAGGTGLVLAELECETTHVARVQVAGRTVASDVVLERGDHLTIEAAPGEMVRLVGRYVTAFDAVHQPSVTRRLVRDFARQRAAGS